MSAGFIYSVWPAHSWKKKKKKKTSQKTSVEEKGEEKNKLELHPNYIVWTSDQEPGSLAWQLGRM